jgi:hypothetical protein
MSWLFSEYITPATHHEYRRHARSTLGPERGGILKLITLCIWLCRQQVMKDVDAYL